MKRRFVIGVDGLTASKSKSFREYLGSLGGWWHWIENFWLLITENEDVAVDKIRDQAKALGANRVVVFEFPEEVDWTTSGPRNSKGRPMGDWLKTTWAGAVSEDDGK